MNLEEKKVLLSRWNLKRDWNAKEWWYTGIYDSNSNIYFSFFFVRVNLIDQFSFTLFDPAMNRPVHFSKKLYLEKEQKKNMLSLNYHSKNLVIEYNGDEIKGWEFSLKNKEYRINLQMKPTIPCFTKHNNEFVYTYSLLHFFNNLTTGTISVPGKTFSITNSLCYYDHCFGSVPSKMGWHWIAIQNESVSLASLSNYGAHAQRYTQVYFMKNDRNLGLERWIRLNQDVSFGNSGENKYNSNWEVTSPDMELVLTPIMHFIKSEKIPFLINLTHTEFYIKARGRVRVDGQWIEIRNLYGVMEEHSGKW